MESETKELQKQYIYVYGIINNKDIKLDIKGLKNEPIKKINFEDITVLTSSYPALNPVLKEEEAMQYAKILKKIAEKTTVIPMSFGMVFKDERILELTLSKSYVTVKETLELIKNKIELGVKVIKKQSEDEPNGIAQEILESLNKLSIKSVKGNNFSDRLLLNYSFLVEKNNFAEFSAKIAELEVKHKDLKFIYTGPWPLYSFVNISIKAD